MSDTLSAISYSPTGSWKSVSDRVNSDGFDHRVTITRREDLIVTSTRQDATTPYNRATVTDSKGKVYQTLEWQPGIGYTIE